MELLVSTAASGSAAEDGLRLLEGLGADSDGERAVARRTDAPPVPSSAATGTSM